MLGGISMNEVAQVQQQLQRTKALLPPSAGLSSSRVILLSNRIINGDMALQDFFNFQL